MGLKYALKRFISLKVHLKNPSVINFIKRTFNFFQGLITDMRIDLSGFNIFMH